MTAVRETFQNSRFVRILEPGSESPLDSMTPGGIFETGDRDRYLITSHRGRRYAVVLMHRTRQKFSYRVLARNAKALEHGRWIGPYCIRLTAYLPGEPVNPPPGVVGLFERHAHLVCKNDGREARWMQLGDAGQRALELCEHYGTPFLDFDGWSIEAFATEPQFHDQPSPREPTWYLEVQPEFPLFR